MPTCASVCVDVQHTHQPGPHIVSREEQTEKGVDRDDPFRVPTRREFLGSPPPQHIGCRLIREARANQPMSALGTFWALERAAVRREGRPREVEQVRSVNLALAFKLVELRERAGGERAGGEECRRWNRSESQRENHIGT